MALKALLALFSPVSFDWHDSPARAFYPLAHRVRGRYFSPLGIATWFPSLFPVTLSPMASQSRSEIIFPTRLPCRKLGRPLRLPRAKRIRRSILRADELAVR